MADIFKVWMFDDPDVLWNDNDLSQLLIGISVIRVHGGFGDKESVYNRKHYVRDIEKAYEMQKDDDILIILAKFIANEERSL